MIHTLARSSWLRLLLTAAILAYLATRLDMGDALRALVTTDVRALLVVLVLVACDRAVMIWRWVLLLRSSGTAIATGAAARIFLVSSFVGSFLPAGVGADAARAYALMRHTARGGDAVASVAIDRYLGIVALTLLGAAGALSSARFFPAEQRGFLAGAAVLFTVASVALFWLDHLVEWFMPQALRGGNFYRRLSAAARSMGDYRDRPGTLLQVLVLSFVVQALRILQAWVLGLGLGIAVPFGYYLAFMPVGLLLLLLPVSVSGFGVPQAMIVWLLRPMGVPEAQAFALSTLIVLSGLAGNLPGAWLYLRGRRPAAPPGAPGTSEPAPGSALDR